MQDLCVILSGKPYSGKSFISNLIKQEFQKLNYSVVILESDEFEKELLKMTCLYFWGIWTLYFELNQYCIIDSVLFKSNSFQTFCTNKFRKLISTNARRIMLRKFENEINLKTKDKKSEKLIKNKLEKFQNEEIFLYMLINNLFKLRNKSKYPRNHFRNKAIRKIISKKCVYILDDNNLTFDSIIKLQRRSKQAKMISIILLLEVSQNCLFERRRRRTNKVIPIKFIQQSKSLFAILKKKIQLNFQKIEFKSKENINGISLLKKETLEFEDDQYILHINSEK